MSESSQPNSDNAPFRSLYSDDEVDPVTPDDPASPRPKKGCFRIFSSLFIGVAILGILAACAAGIYYNVKAYTFDMDRLQEVPERTLVYDRKGELLGHLSGHGENRLRVDSSEVSENFINALLAREDSRFFSHKGVDYRGVGRAMIANLKSGGMDQGASTLTMQLARNAFEMREKSINRKLMEVALAQRIERNHEKSEILTFYMNRIYFGAGLYGIERASQGFFMKPASDLTLGEGAMLAGIIRGPSLLNPFRSLESAKDTRDEVLARMIAEGSITKAEAGAAKVESIALRPPDQRLATGSYILQTVFDLLETRLADPEDIKLGGFRVYTTIDSDLQAAAEKALDGHLTKIENRSGFPHPKKSAHKKGQATRYVQGAVVSLDNASGAIRAIVGGRDYGDSSYNRAYMSKRQAGSTFKPLVYAVAIDRGGLLPGNYVSDDAIRIDTGGGPVWSPKNSDGTFTGLQPAAIGLIKSRNTMSIRVGQIAGLDNVRSLASALKFGELPNSPVIYLGAFETNPLTLTSAYSTLPTGGVNYTPFLIRKIERSNGEVFDEHEINGVDIFPESVSYVTNDIMAKVMDEGTGRGARSAGYQAATYGKTGTTNDYKDAWFVGYTDKITTGVWVGLDQPKTIMNRGYGSTLALPIWTEVMKEAETCGFKAEAIAPPDDTQNVVLCRECGLLQGRKTRNPYQMPLPPDLKPRASCRGHGFSLFTDRNNNQQPGAIPIPGFGQPGQPSQAGQPAQQGQFQPRPQQPRPQDGDAERVLRGIGRLLFGGDPRRDR